VSSKLVAIQVFEYMRALQRLRDTKIKRKKGSKVGPCYLLPYIFDFNYWLKSKYFQPHYF